MPTVLQLRRGTTAQNNAFTGSAGELTFNTTTGALRAHDGTTAGGAEMLVNDGSNASISQSVTLSGDVSGSATITNLGNLAITTTVADDSHNHSSSSGAFTVGTDLTVSGGDIILSGTGRIQGIDTVTDGTDAANKTYVDTAITNLIGGAPGALDTLNELAAAINDDASYASTITTALGTKAAAATTISAGTGLTGGGSLAANRTISLSHLGIQSLVDPDADRIMFWDDSAGATAWLTVGSNLTLSGTTLSADTQAPVAGSGITVSGTTVSHADTSSQASVDNSGNTFIQDLTLDTYGHITAITSGTAVINNATLTLAVSGTGLSGSQTFTANQSTNATFTVTSNATSANTASTIVARDASGNFTAGVITATTTAARYADLAEKYSADADYAPGTVVMFGGDEEVTAANEFATRKVAGVVSTEPAHIMNDALVAEHVITLALAGRVPCCVTGVCYKGDLIVASNTAGVAIAWNDVMRDPPAGAIIGKALENKTEANEGTIEVVVGVR